MTALGKMQSSLCRYAWLSLGVPFLKKRETFFCSCEKKDTEKVFIFGDGRALLKDVEVNGETSFFKNRGLRVQSISFGDSIASCLTENGELHIWGSYEEILSGNVRKQKFIDPIIIPTTETIKDVQFSQQNIYLLTEKGQLKIIRNYEKCLRKGEFPIEHFYSFPSRLFWTEKIVRLSVNKYHLAFVTNHGSLYCSGRNSFGQCGKPPLISTNINRYIFSELNTIPTNTSMNDVDEERQNSLKKMGTNFSTNKFHTKPQVDWGKNTVESENITNDTQDYITMNKIKFNERTRIIDVSCGLNHTVCVDDQDRVYTFGDDSKIQLGLGESRTTQNTQRGTKWKEQIQLGYSSTTTNLAKYSFYDLHLKSNPQKILTKMNDIEMIDKVYKINAGSNFSVIFSNDRLGRQLFCFGDNSFFQCGRHLGKHHQTISTVKLPSNDIVNFTCGNNHCLVNINDQIYGWGLNTNGQISPFKNKGIINYPLCVFPKQYYPSSDNTKIKYFNAQYDNSAIVVTEKN